MILCSLDSKPLLASDAIIHGGVDGDLDYCYNYSSDYFHDHNFGSTFSDLLGNKISDPIFQSIVMFRHPAMINKFMVMITLIMVISQAPICEQDNYQDLSE